MATPTSDPIHPVVQTVTSYRQQADQAKRNRMDQNRENLDCYHMRQDWGHKIAGQSKEFLAKQSIAVEQFASFLQQGLIDPVNWFSVEPEPGVIESTITSDDMFKLLGRQLKKADIYTVTGDSLKTGSLQSLMIVKITGKKVAKVSYKVKTKYTWRGAKKVLEREEKPVWQLKLDLIRPEDYYPDPTGRGLYEIQDIEMDLHELIDLAEKYPDDYDIGMVRDLKASMDGEQAALRAKETDQNQTLEATARTTVRVSECWGTILDSTGKVLHENAVCAIANDRFLIRPPKQNPLWHQGSPFVASPILRVPFSVWHKAMMDAPTKHNHALNEVYNLMLDAGLQSVFGVRQIREHWLEDASQVSKGIPAGTTLRVNAACPVGGKVMERVDTSTEFSEAQNIFNLTDREFTSSAFTNDFRTGNLPERSVKATEIVSANQAITGVFNGITKMVEENFMSKILEKSWLECAQNLNDYDSDDVKAILGPEKALLLANLDPAEIFAMTAQGRQFKVFGLSTTINKINDFRKLTALLQTVSGSPELMQAFAQKYDMSAFLGEIVKSLEVNVDKIKIKQTQPGAGGPPGAAPGRLDPRLQQILQQAGGAGAGSVDQSKIPQASTPGRAEGPVTIPRGEMLQGMTNPGG